MGLSLFEKFGKSRVAGVLEGRRLEQEAQTASQAMYRQEALSRCVDRPLIIVPNEWDNPVIGFGKSIMQVGQSGVLVVHNYLSMDDVICGGVRMDFSEQRLEIALALDPYQLWAITAHNAVGHSDYDKPRSGDRWPKQRIMQTLENNGFFARWHEFKAIEQSLD